MNLKIETVVKAQVVVPAVPAARVDPAEVVHRCNTDKRKSLEIQRV
jgi:hypothetical protein